MAYDDTVDPAWLGELLEAAAVPELGDDPAALADRLRRSMAAAGEAVFRILELEGLRPR